MYPSRRARSTGSNFRRFLSGVSTSHRNFDNTIYPIYIKSSLRQFITYFVQRYGHDVPLQQRFRNVSSDATDAQSPNSKPAPNEENKKREETATALTLKSPDSLSAFTTASLFLTQQPKLFKSIELPPHSTNLPQARTDNFHIPTDENHSPSPIASNIASQKHDGDIENEKFHNFASTQSTTDTILGNTLTHESMSHLQPLNENVNVIRPQLIQHELHQLQKQLHHVMEVLEPNNLNESQSIQANAGSSATTNAKTTSIENPLNYFHRMSDPELPPLTAPPDMIHTTIEEILSLPLSAWDDDVWNQGRWLVVNRFQSHCATLVQSERSRQPFDASSTPSPLSSSYDEATGILTMNEVQETLNLLQRLCQVRSDTKHLHSLMNHFFAEVRVVIELQKNLKASNKQLRNEYQFHPSFGVTEPPSDNLNKPSGSNTMKQERKSTKKEEIRNHFNNISLGTVAHMIEVTVYHIMKNRYWYPNTTTVYQTMIQLAAIATVDHKMYSTATSIHHNPGANAEYWLKQQHQASRMNTQPLHSTLTNSYTINAPNRYDYTTVLEGWVATSKIEQQHQHTYNPYDVSQHPSVMTIPNLNADDFASASHVSSSAAASSLYSDSSSYSMAANRAGQLIRQWQFLYSSSDNNPVLKPTESAYSNWLLCIVNCGSRTIKGAAINAARECHDALKEISKRSEKDNFWPGVTLYNILMNAYSKAGDAEAAEAVLHDLIEKAKYNTYCVPDVVSFTTVINAWAQIPHNQAAPDRAERLFHLQQDFATRSGLESLLPTATTVTAVLQCWVKSNHPLAPSRADAILKQMHDMVKAGYSKLQPNVITYNICMNIWGRSGHFDASNKVEELFQILVEQYRVSNYAMRFRPDIATYIARISVWERNRTLTARAIAEKVESTFNELISPIDPMTAKGAIGNADKLKKPRPNQAIYNMVIRAFSNCGDAVAATKYLEAMIADYLDNKNHKAIPNRYVFHYVISAWSRKLSYSGAETAEWWLNRMHHLSTSHPAMKDVAPNAVSYNTCLGAWARFPQGRMIIDTDPNIEVALYEMNEEANDMVHQETNPHQSQPLQSSTMTKCPTVIAMERGQHLFHRMKQNNIRPDVYTYGALLHIISNQKQCTKHVKYTQAQSIIEKMVRDNTEMNSYIYRLLKKCGVNSLPNYNLNYNQRGSTPNQQSNAGGAKSSTKITNRTKPNRGEPLLVRTTDTSDIAESI